MRQEVVNYVVCVRGALGKSEYSGTTKGWLDTAISAKLKLADFRVAGELDQELRKASNGVDLQDRGNVRKVLDDCSFIKGTSAPTPSPSGPKDNRKSSAAVRPPSGLTRKGSEDMGRSGVPVAFTGMRAVEIGQFGKKCSVDERTGDLVLEVTARRLGTEAGQAYAGCCIEFDNLHPGGADRAAVLIRADRSEPELHVKLENVKSGYRYSMLHEGFFEGSSPRVVETNISDDLIRQHVDKFCIVAKGQRGEGSVENVIRARTLEFK